MLLGSYVTAAVTVSIIFMIMTKDVVEASVKKEVLYFIQYVHYCWLSYIFDLVEIV